jgi:hypothetical protein
MKTMTTISIDLEDGNLVDVISRGDDVCAKYQFRVIDDDGNSISLMFGSYSAFNDFVDALKEFVDNN